MPQHLTLEIYQRYWGVELLISKITGSVLGYPVPQKYVMFISIT